VSPNLSTDFVSTASTGASVICSLLSRNGDLWLATY
jgi:hypothetical protein